MDEKEFHDLMKKYMEIHSREHRDISLAIIGTSREIEKLKFKSSVWGLMGASIPTLITVLMLILRSKA